MRNYHTVFQSGYTTFYSYQQCTWILICQHPHQHILLLSAFFIIVILMGVKWYLIAILIYISPMTSDFEHVFMCALAICTWKNPLSLKKIFFWKICFLCSFLMSLLFSCLDIGILDINMFWILTPCQIYDLQIFSLIL